MVRHRQQLEVGGDNKTRTVLVALDADPHPERRSGFVLGDLESWIEEPANQRLLLTAVLALVADWAAAGCPQASVTPMRQYTTWARACGGFLPAPRLEGASWPTSRRWRIWMTTLPAGLSS